MAARIYPIQHKGKTIYYSDWSNIIIEAEIYAAIEETTLFVEQLGEYGLYEIVDVRGTITPASAMGLVIESAKRTKPFGKRKAIVGVTGTKLTILKAVNRFIDGNIQGFSDLEAAKEWLVNEG
ncbi:MAG: hypothetical protein ACERKD_05830 [Prolixibacteraceae bacterium]